MECRVQNHKM